MDSEKMISDPLEPDMEYLTKEVDGTQVRLYHWFATKEKPEDWYVEIGLGGQIRPEHFKNYEDAKIYYDSVNYSIIAIANELREIFDKKNKLKMRVHDAMSRAIFNQEPLKEDEKV